MHIEIDSKIKCHGLDWDTAKRLMKKLTIENPAYKKARAIGRPTWGIAREIKLYEQKDNVLIIPRGFPSELLSSMIPFVRILDNTFKGCFVDFESQIELRAYQAPAIEIAKSKKQGVVVMPCGGGKTETGLAISAALNTPVLWIAHTNSLVEQACDRAKIRLKLNPGEYGIIGDGNYVIGSKITFATVQTLAKRDISELTKYVGCVIVDECHHLFKDDKSVGIFYNVISQFPALYRFGLTATATRSDGLIETMHMALGQTIYQVTEDQLKGNVIAPHVEFIKTDFRFDSSEDDSYKYFKLLKNAMINNEQRNNLICDTIFKKMRPGDIGIVLGDTLAHLKQLHDYFKSYFRCEYIDGKTKKPERERIFEMIRNRKCDLLFATFQLAKEGLDLPPLNTLFLIAPKTDPVTVQQAAGRIARPAEGKTDARIFDFVDHQVGMCYNQGKKRFKVYKDKGYPIAGKLSKKDKEKEVLNKL